MTLGNMREADREERNLQRAKRNKELLEELYKNLNSSEIKFSDVNVDTEKYDEAGSVSLSFELKDGFKQQDNFYWEWNESIKEISDTIIKHCLYIQKLREEYPSYAMQNDYIQGHRVFNRSCKLAHSNTKTFVIVSELCGKLKLPNSTDYSCGGGDYEFKKTPERVRDFKKNVDNICLFMSDCIAELRQMKREIEELEILKE